MAPWPDSRLVHALVRRHRDGVPRSLPALVDGRDFYDLSRAGPSLFTLFAWQRRPTRREACRLVRHLIAALGCYYIEPASVKYLQRALATELPTGEAFPLSVTMQPLAIFETRLKGFVITADAIVYDRTLVTVFRHRYELYEGVGSVTVTRLVSAAAGEVMAFRHIVDGLLALDVHHHD